MQNFNAYIEQQPIILTLLERIEQLEAELEKVKAKSFVAPSKYASKAELADEYGISQSSIDKLRLEGHLKWKNIGRRVLVERSSMATYLEGQ